MDRAKKLWIDNGLLYDKAQEKYAKIRYPQHIYRYNRIFEMLDKVKRPGSKLRLLDIGCGYGTVLEYAAKNWGGEVECYGVDYAPSMVELAKKKLKGRPIKVTIGDALDLSQFKDSFFDVVCANQIYGYLPRQKEKVYYGEAWRVLKPGGSLITAEANNLFDIATFNKFTIKFFNEHFLSLSFKSKKPAIANLLSFPEAPSAPKKSAGSYVDQLLDDPATKYSSHREQANSKAENPLDYPRLMTQYGFTVKDLAFYHFHPTPPLLFQANPKFEKLGMRLEDKYCRSWQGYFMASSFVCLLKK